MIRPVWHSPRHSEAATSEALQSDVMRFIAILALCLVAIFALVRSLPLRPVAEPDAASPSAETSPSDRSPTARASPEAPPDATPAPATAPAIAREAQPRPEPAETQAPPRHPQAPEPATPATPARPAQRPGVAPVETSASTTSQGLTLRFASDTALLALLAQRRIGVYAWVRDAAWQLSSQRSVLRFAPSAAPKRFYSMTPETVPGPIADALQSAAPSARADTVTWGVTLPADMARRLERLVVRHRNGSLIIGANGRVRFEQGG